MDEETGEVKGTVGNLDQVDEGRSENLSRKRSDSNNGVVLNSVKTEAVLCEPLNEATATNSDHLVDEAALETVIVANSGDTVSVTGENEVFAVNIDELGSIFRMKNQETCCGVQDGESSDQFEQERGCALSNSGGRIVVETVIVITSECAAGIGEGNGESEVKHNELRPPSKVSEDDTKTKVAEAEKHSSVMEMKIGIGGGVIGKENWDGEKVCRICHLSSEGLLETTAGTTTSTATTMDLIQLCCGCKDELGIAHSHCAETWFKLKGNRKCEICGETAKNVTGVGDNCFMEDLNERRVIDENGISSSEMRRGCWTGQTFCNMLMACLVIAFVLPWFFRVNMF